MLFADMGFLGSTQHILQETPPSPADCCVQIDEFIPLPIISDMK